MAFKNITQAYEEYGYENIWKFLTEICNLSDTDAAEFSAYDGELTVDDLKVYSLDDTDVGTMKKFLRDKGVLKGINPKEIERAKNWKPNPDNAWDILNAPIIDDDDLMESKKISNKKVLKEWAPSSKHEALDWIENELNEASELLDDIENTLGEDGDLERLLDDVEKLRTALNYIKEYSSEGLKLDESKKDSLKEERVTKPTAPVTKKRPVGPGLGIGLTFDTFFKKRGLKVSREGDYSKAEGLTVDGAKLKIVLRADSGVRTVFLDVYVENELIDQFKSKTIEDYQDDIREIKKTYL